MLYINDGDKLSLSTKNFNQTLHTMKNNQNNVVAIFEKMVAAMPANWMPTETEICEAWIASQSLFPKGIFPSEYNGPAKGAFAPLVTLTALCEAAKIAVRKAIAWVSETASKICAMATSLYKGRRKQEELTKWMVTNPKGFVIAWHPAYRTYDKVAEWCGEAEAKQLFGL